MAKIAANISTRVYGIKVGIAVGRIFQALGASYDQAHRCAMSCVFLRTVIDGKTVGWVWLGARHGE